MFWYNLQAKHKPKQPIPSLKQNFLFLLNNPKMCSANDSPPFQKHPEGRQTLQPDEPLRANQPLLFIYFPSSFFCAPHWNRDRHKRKREGRRNLLNASKFPEWTIRSLGGRRRGGDQKERQRRAEALLLISRLHFGRLLWPWRGATPRAWHSFIVPSQAAHRSSLGVARDSPHGLFLVCACVRARVNQPRFMCANTPALSGGVRFSARLYGSKLAADGRAEHFNGTHLPLTPFNLLTCINRF